MDDSCGFWTEGADEYVSELQKEHNAQLDKLQRQLKAASTPKERAEAEAALRIAAESHKQKIAEVPKLLF